MHRPFRYLMFFTRENSACKYSCAWQFPGAAVLEAVTRSKALDVIAFADYRRAARHRNRAALIGLPQGSVNLDEKSVKMRQQREALDIRQRHGHAGRIAPWSLAVPAIRAPRPQLSGDYDLSTANSTPWRLGWPRPTT
jgi:hypothetical protein